MNVMVTICISAAFRMANLKLIGFREIFFPLKIGWKRVFKELRVKPGAVENPNKRN